jgi:hypothetical protein
MSCETCRHWQPLQWPAEMRSEDGFALYDENDEPIIAPLEWGNCRRVDDLGPSSQSSRFYVQDASMYSASLNTRSDFACIEHTQKEA